MSTCVILLIQDLLVDALVQDEDTEQPGRVRGEAILKVYFPHDNSEIAVYTDGRFQATCRHWEQDTAEKCRLTRTTTASENPEEAPAQGRPLGLLSAWLLHSNLFNHIGEHTDPFGLYLLDYEKRCRAREYLKTLPAGLLLLTYERDQRPGEPEEPEEWA